MPRKTHPLEAGLFGSLPPELSQNLRALNPWWEDKPGPQLPAFRRWPFDRLLQLTQSGITPATVLRGPRRVGKTVLLRQVIERLLGQGVDPTRILYVPFVMVEIGQHRRVKHNRLLLHVSVQSRGGKCF